MRPCFFALILFKIEGKGYHLAPCLVNRFRHLYQSVIKQIRSILGKYVKQTKTKLQLWNEFEEGQVEVTSHTHLHVAVEHVEAERAVLLIRQIERWCQTRDEVRTEVIVARSGHLNVQGKGDQGALNVLRSVAS